MRRADDRSINITVKRKKPLFLLLKNPNLKIKGSGHALKLIFKLYGLTCKSISQRQ